MPAGKRQQSNATLYTLITFVALFVAATTLAVIFYVKLEEQKSKAETAENELNDIATRKERQKIGSIVGKNLKRKSTLGTMVEYLDQVVNSIIGGFQEDTSAEVKVEAAERKTKEILNLLEKDYSDFKGVKLETTSLLEIIDQLKTNLDNTNSAQLHIEEQLADLQKRFDDTVTASEEKEQVLLEEKSKYEQQVNDIKNKYNELKELLEQSSEQRVSTLIAQRDQARATNKDLKEKLLKTQAQFKQAENRMKLVLKQLREIKPVQISDVAAYKHDGKVLLVNENARTVHIDIGSDDRVYRGLTFSVYDKNMSIPKDGKGKAEIEVFDIQEKISIARIIRSEIKNPILTDDIVANLIWDSDKINVFVVAGKFDLDYDGIIDENGIEKVNNLIRKWGGRVADSISIDTDFLVLGKAPKIGQKPTLEEMEIYPLAMEKYQASLEEYDHYNEVASRAQALSVPIFNTERFLYLIGYKVLSKEAGAFN